MADLSPPAAGWRRAALWIDVAVYVGFWIATALRRPRTPAWWAGLGLGLVAFSGWVTARVQLGSAFTVRPEARHLVESGLYSRLRHPIYLFGTLAYLGALVAFQNAALLVAWLAFNIVVQGARIRREERVLAARFPEAYRAYRARTWF